MPEKIKFPDHPVWNRLFLALQALATKNESLQIRLEDAYHNLRVLHIREFPKELQSEFETIIKTFDEYNFFSDEPLLIDNLKAEQLAIKILELYDSIAREYTH